jgi:hypothetical protein
VADILTTEPPAPAVSQAAAQAGSESQQYSRTGDMIKARMPEMVKGAGYVTGSEPLKDPMQILTKAHQATLDLRTETYRGIHHKADVVKNLNQGFLNQFGYLKTALSAPSLGESLQQILGGVANPDLTRSFTAGNLGIGSVYGLVPFDLLAPSRLIYPVYTVFRNKLPRPAGQGTSRIERVFTGISGSQTGGQGVIDIGIPELVQSTGNFGNWPLNLPGAGAQTEVQLNVPYKFFGLTEQLSWLAQFAGQGFEDVAALANLILLQQMMMAEEYQMIAGTSQALATPGQPTATVRNAGSNETALNTNITAVKVSAANYWGETAVSAASTTFAVSAGQVVDVTIPAVSGALFYNIYAYTSGSSYYKLGSQVGGTKFTLQGYATLPSAVTPPAADTGTGKSVRMEGIVPTLSGASATAGVYPTSPVSWQGGYVNQSVGQHLNYNVLYTALDALWESNSNSPGAFKADPAEVVGDGGDLMRLSQDIIAQGTATNYRLFLEQGDVAGVRLGAAVSEFQNPVTRSVLKLLVHPWYPQGTATLMTYQLPQTWTNVANAWEMTVVQDYVSIAWPVIDATFRYSIFLYGALVAHAPQYSGLLQGLQVSDTTPYQ